MAKYFVDSHVGIFGVHHHHHSAVEQATTNFPQSLWSWSAKFAAESLFGLYYQCAAKVASTWTWKLFDPCDISNFIRRWNFDCEGFIFLWEFTFGRCQVNWFTLSWLRTTDWNDHNTKPMAYHNLEPVHELWHEQVTNGY